MDFITQLPLSKNFDSILLVWDRFSKMEILIATNPTRTSLDVSQIFNSLVFSKHVLPVSIVSDRGSFFVSSLWTQFCKQLNISRDLSTAFHPQTDGQTERPSPFFTIYGRNPIFALIHVSQDIPAERLSTKLQSVQQLVKEKLVSQIRHIMKYSDRNRTILPDFHPGHKVWLSQKNINTKRPTKKLSERWLGPFEVLKNIGRHAYDLKLPQQWKSVHLVFQVSLLEPVNQSNSTNVHQFPPPPVLVEEQDEWEVAQVLDSNSNRGKLWYLLEWK
ncbi:hypothetical protein O181_038622 [Austropuccinia psidii MF-1]|uniref:Integrase catalytic domain-containing protein n=1 Tax=Austropuccinia psidii MF-1 TaxID=1389203 RepID=A0A9Q3DBA2_9BASI|nr:hypothetical protein [Austropuccinia psidii MF-1]